AELGDGEKPAGVVEQAADSPGARMTLLGELLDPASTDRHERDLGGDKEPLEERQQDDHEDVDHQPAAPPSGPRSGPSGGPSGGRWCGSRIRAGTPTASLPAGTSRVTTAPAPVRAPSPISRGATTLVSTAM